MAGAVQMGSEPQDTRFVLPATAGNSLHKNNRISSDSAPTGLVQRVCSRLWAGVGDTSYHLLYITMQNPFTDDL